MRGTRGFTIVELLMVLLIISILTRLAFPLVRQARRSAQATAAIGAATTLRTTAYTYQASTSRWPATTAIGRVPGGLGSLLPAGFRFVTPDYRLQWVVTQTRSGGVNRVVPIVRLYITDPALCARTAGTLGGLRNRDIVASCRGLSGYVSWSFDR
jgi:prepilin-type N-terminal cleavage/methylation domain-containing protein